MASKKEKRRERAKAPVLMPLISLFLFLSVERGGSAWRFKFLRIKYTFERQGNNSWQRDSGSG